MPKDITVAETVQPMRPREYSNQQMALIKRTVAKDTNDDEFSLFMEVARRSGLDPFRRQIYANVYNKDKPAKRQMVIITGIDGFRATAQRCGNYRPDEEEYRIIYNEDLKDPETNPLGIEKANVILWQFGPDREWHPVTGTAYWDEFVPLKEVWEYSQAEGKRVFTGRHELSNNFWKTKGRNQIAKCAEANGLRKGWPEELSGIYAPEEMEATYVETTAAEMIEQFKTEERLKAINHKKAVAICWAVGEPVEFVPMGQFVDRCLEYFRQEDIPQRLEWWLATNSQSLQLFWAEHKSDALEIKEASEDRLQTLFEAQSQLQQGPDDQRPAEEQLAAQGAAE